MKSLSEYIIAYHKNQLDEESKNLYNITTILYHEKYEDYKLSTLGIRAIFEGDSVFNQCYELSYIVSEVIKNNFKNIRKNDTAVIMLIKDELESKGIKNIPFLTCNINIEKISEKYENFKGDGNYETDIADMFWDIENKMFNVNNITIRLPYDFYEHEKYCTDILAHEFQHLYRDYDEHLSNNSINNIVKGINKKSKKSKFNDDDRKIIQNYAHNIERQSYLAQLEGELGNRKFRTTKDAIEWLDKNSRVWKIYKEAKRTSERSSKEVQIMFHKGWKKFINHLGHLLLKHIDEVLKLENFIDFIGLFEKSKSMDDIIKNIKIKI